MRKGSLVRLIKLDETEKVYRGTPVMERAIKQALDLDVVAINGDWIKVRVTYRSSFTCNIKDLVLIYK